MATLRLTLAVGLLPTSVLIAVLVSPSSTAAADEPKLGKVVLEAKGYLVPATQVIVIPKVAGEVVEIRIEEGQQVKRGEVLARLDPTEYEAALQLARAELTLAEAELAKAKDGLPADVAIGEAKVKVAQAKLAIAQYRLACTAIRAPMAGTVVVKRAEVGTRLDPHGFSVPATLCHLSDLRTLDVEIWVQERDLAKVAQGQPCLIRMEAIPDATYKGTVVRILPVADRARGAVGLRVRVDVPNGDHRLRPELSALVQFLAKE
jgi:RND family efflux transporter MFP subunit